MLDGSSNSIINFGDISKPATVLIEKISQAVGGCFRPCQTRRVAKAEAEADIIRARAEIEITELQRRALNRFVEEEAQKQENIENITKKAIPHLTESAQPEKMENDWITNFFDKCRIISDEEMQSLWAKVLAGEASAPGTYSKRTVNLLSSLDKTDADLFTTLCVFGWSFGNEIVPLIFDITDDTYTKKGINFPAITHLDNVGLVNYNHLTGFLRVGLPKITAIQYYNTSVIIDFKRAGDNELSTGHVLLTKTGQELARICGAKPIDSFLDYIVNKWKKDGLSVILPNQSAFFNQPF